MLGLFLLAVTLLSSGRASAQEPAPRRGAPAPQRLPNTPRVREAAVDYLLRAPRRAVSQPAAPLLNRLRLTPIKPGQVRPRPAPAPAPRKPPAAPRKPADAALPAPPARAPRPATPAPQTPPSPAAYAEALYTYLTKVQTNPRRWGSRGKPNDDIRKAQQGMGKLAADGIYGPKTRNRGRDLTGRTFPKRG